MTAPKCTDNTVSPPEEHAVPSKLHAHFYDTNQICANYHAAFPINWDGAKWAGEGNIESDGFGIPWGHARSFASRQSHNESAGRGE
jgi:hypothetical protein